LETQLSSGDLKRVRVYIDGFNVYHAIDGITNPTLKWLNYKLLSKQMLREGETLDSVHFFTAVLTWNHIKQQRHKNYIAALRAAGVCIHEAHFKKGSRYCRGEARYCDFYEEKQTDVALAIAIVTDALADKFDRAILITADSDQIPTVKFVQTLPGKSITVRFPPGRASQARALGDAATDKKELTVGQMQTCLLPRTVCDATGKAVAHMPALYLGIAA
jgi:uncharacterized LabA/DUF88 family protein